jgi:hypothetical protein
VAPATAVAGAATTTPDPALAGAVEEAPDAGAVAGAPVSAVTEKEPRSGKSHTTPGKRRHRWHSWRVTPVASDDGRVTDTVHALF